MRTSIMNDKEAMENAIANATSIKTAIQNLGLRAAGGNYRAFKLACERHGISVPQFDRSGQLRDIRKSFGDLDIFVENSTYTNRTRLKERMFKMGVPNQCALCGQLPVWNHKPLTLQLDHINGISNDHRLSNLRILCGHCHSQTPTFCGSNKSKPEN